MSFNEWQKNVGPIPIKLLKIVGSYETPLAKMTFSRVKSIKNDKYLCPFNQI
jgi:hypothetical protein